MVRYCTKLLYQGKWPRVRYQTVPIGCEAHDILDKMVDRWLSSGGGNENFEHGLYRESVLRK